MRRCEISNFWKDVVYVYFFVNDNALEYFYVVFYTFYVVLLDCRDVNFIRFVDIAQYNPQDYCSSVFNGENLETNFGDDKQVEKDVIFCLSKILSNEISPYCHVVGVS